MHDLSESTSMGVPGLTTFLDINNHILVDVMLRDAQVVIDGNNLYHFLYHHYSVPTAYGGDYDKFYTATQSFFLTLSQCNITPIVVFDGPYDPTDTKIHTSIRRARERLNNLHNRSSKKYMRTTPLMANSVFLDVLNDLNIDHVTCDAEADSEIAALANALECPVLTNDSDFFVFAIKAGVILLDYVNLELRRDKDPKLQEGKSKRYIKVQKYDFEMFCRLFPGVGRDHMALFATMMGNDRVPAETFDSFFSAVRLPSHSEKVFHGQKQHKMVGVLSWLGKVSTFDHALDTIVRHCPKEQRKKLRNVIVDSADTYRNISISRTVAYFRTKWEQPSTLELTPPSVETVNDRRLPGWFVRDLHRGRLSPLVVNVAVSHRVILLPQPENLCQPSAHWPAQPLRRLVYTAVLTGCWQCDLEPITKLQCDQEPITKLQCDQEPITKLQCDQESQEPITKLQCVEEIDRKLKAQTRNNVRIRTELNNGKVVPSLVEVQQLSPEGRKSIVLGGLGVTSGNLQQWPAELQLYLATVVYFINNAEPKLNWLHVASIILCFLRLGLDKVISKDAMPGSDNGKSCLNPSTDTSDTVRRPATDSSDTVPRPATDSSDTVPRPATDSRLLFSAGLPQLISATCHMQEILCVKDKLDKFSLPSKGKGSGDQSGDLDYSILHTFSQLQACVLAASGLNQVMMSPLVAVRLGEVFSGTFLYNMYKDLRSRSKPDLYIPELLERSPNLIHVYQLIKRSLLNCVNEGVLVMDVFKKGKQSKKSRHTQKTQTNVKSRTESGEEKLTENTKVKLVANCDLTNKFGCLLPSDSD